MIRLLSSRPVLVAVGLLLIAGTLLVYSPLVSGQPFAYDESDYMWAGRQGIWANAIDKGAIPFTEYVRRGLELGRDPSKRAEFSRFIRESGDLGMYRHYHGPVFYYWIGLLDLLGVEQEAVYRGAGLWIHAATAFLILLAFWQCFPLMHPLAGFAAFSLYLFNRTALVAATTLTQHSMFTFWAAVMLFLLVRYATTRVPLWLYAASGAMACALATVETAAVLGVALLSTVLYLHWPIGGKIRELLGLLLRASFAFLLALLLVWPAGILLLGSIKGFMMLGYIAVYRKTFSPLGPLELLRIKVEASPWELVFLIAAALSCYLVWRSARHQAELVPWLAFTTVFFLILLKITAPYNYYYAPLTMACSVLAGYALGEYGMKGGALVATALALLTIVSISGGAWQQKSIMQEVVNERNYLTPLIGRLRSGPLPQGRLHVPYEAVPTLHYYFPALKTQGFDVDWTPQALTESLRSREAASWMVCEEPQCNALDSILQNRQLLDRRGPNRKPVYTAEVRTQ